MTISLAILLSQAIEEKIKKKLFDYISLMIN